MKAKNNFFLSAFDSQYVGRNMYIASRKQIFAVYSYFLMVVSDEGFRGKFVCRRIYQSFTE